MLGFMDSMKGPGTVVISCQTSGEDDGNVINLLRFVDGSWGIERNRELAGIWEPAELDECVRVFALQTGVRDPANQFSVLFRIHPAVAAAAPPGSTC